MTAGEALQAGRNRLAHTSSHPRRDAEILLGHVLQCEAVYLFAHPERVLSVSEADQYECLLACRAAEEPMQYITGTQEFFGLAFCVTPAVLIPRPETEHLVEAALERIAPDAEASILDVGTGSGAIAVALAHARSRIHVTAVDLSVAALAVAQSNAQRLGVGARITFRPSDLLDAVQDQHYDLIVSNPPYIAEAEVLEPQVANYEPHNALYAGPSGLEIYQRLIPQAARALQRDGWLLLEIGYGQRSALLQLLSDWAKVTVVPDLQGIPRVLCAQKA